MTSCIHYAMIGAPPGGVELCEGDLTPGGSLIPPQKFLSKFVQRSSNSVFVATSATATALALTCDQLTCNCGRHGAYHAFAPAAITCHLVFVVLLIVCLLTKFCCFFYPVHLKSLWICQCLTDWWYVKRVVLRNDEPILPLSQCTLFTPGGAARWSH
jgi:hypothetical protein